MSLLGGIFLQFVDVIQVHVEDIVRVVQDLHHLLFRTSHANPLQAVEFSDAVILVDDVIAAHQTLELPFRETFEFRLAPAAAPFEPAEDLVLRVHREAGIRDEKTFVKGIEGKGELRDINLCRFIVPRLIMLMNRTEEFLQPDAF